MISQRYIDITFSLGKIKDYEYLINFLVNEQSIDMRKVIYSAINSIGLV